VSLLAAIDILKQGITLDLSDWFFTKSVVTNPEEEPVNMIILTVGIKRWRSKLLCAGI
jgi:hypothetical protein